MSVELPWELLRALKFTNASGFFVFASTTVPETVQICAGRSDAYNSRKYRAKKNRINFVIAGGNDPALVCPMSFMNINVKLKKVNLYLYKSN